MNRLLKGPKFIGGYDNNVTPARRPSHHKRLSVLCGRIEVKGHPLSKFR